jgi:hypothetical protein
VIYFEQGGPTPVIVDDEICDWTEVYQVCGAMLRQKAARMKSCSNLKALIFLLVGLQAVYVLHNVYRQEKGLLGLTTTVAPITTPAIDINQTIESFLDDYEAYCQQHLLPTQPEVSYFPKAVKADKPFCPCVPSELGKLCLALISKVIRVGELYLPCIQHTLSVVCCVLLKNGRIPCM